MTSIFYEDIKLSDSSIKSIEKCEILSQTKERIALDKRRKTLMSKVSAKKEKLGYRAAYRR
jgi:hypothetical protein